MYFVVGGGEGKNVTKYWTLLGAARHKLCLHNISIYIHLILYLDVFYSLKNAYRNTTAHINTILSNKYFIQHQ